MALAGEQRRMKAVELADHVDATAGFLTQAMSPLVARGWVVSEPGPTGGYRLDVGLEDVSILDVIEAVEGPTDTGRCVLENRPCGGSAPCALHRPWTTARSEFLTELATTSLSDLPRPTKQEAR
jgi:Rrf2 family protein